MVYGNNKSCKEDDHTVFLTPYASSKGCVDYMLDSVGKSRAEWSLISLRYFNVCGAHDSGLLGDCQKYPNHLFPYIEEVMAGKREILSVFGNDYPTKDGTGVRDYIHVVDLANAHLYALNKQKELKGHHIYNIGTNTGYSVLDIIKTYSSAVGRQVPYKIVDRRLGDSDITMSSSDKAQRELNWKPQKTLFDMCRDSFRWRSKTPDGYE
jgi:UDP-glucose 4-epimerase